jgi:hypothetical protein
MGTVGMPMTSKGTNVGIEASQRAAIAHGTRLVARYKGEEHVAEVMDGTDGKPRYRLADGRVFTSPSSAGKAITGRASCDGWKFWTVAEAVQA